MIDNILLTVNVILKAGYKINKQSQFLIIIIILFYIGNNLNKHFISTFFSPLWSRTKKKKRKEEKEKIKGKRGKEKGKKKRNEKVKKKKTSKLLKRL